MVVCIAERCARLNPKDLVPKNEPLELQTLPRLRMVLSLSASQCAYIVAPLRLLMIVAVHCSQGKTDTILVDIWTSIAPNGSITPAAVWAKLESPDSRMWETTGLLGVPMNVTFRNATIYTARSPLRFALAICWNDSAITSQISRTPRMHVSCVCSQRLTAYQTSRSSRIRLPSFSHQHQRKCFRNASMLFIHPRVLPGIISMSSHWNVRYLFAAFSLYYSYSMRLTSV